MIILDLNTKRTEFETPFNISGIRWEEYSECKANFLDLNFDPVINSSMENVLLRYSHQKVKSLFRLKTQAMMPTCL